MVLPKLIETWYNDAVANGVIPTALHGLTNTDAMATALHEAGTITLGKPSLEFAPDGERLRLNVLPKDFPEEQS